MAPETAPRSAPLALWRAARAFVVLLLQTLDAPEHIAQRHVFTQNMHALFCEWLRAGEAIVRQLLLIEAAALPRPGEAPRARESRRAPVGEAAPVQIENAAEWRVSFRCFAGSGAGARMAHMKTARRFYSSFPLAARLEALVRAYNDPIPFARRLLRRLLRQPARAKDLLREPEPKQRHAPRSCAYIPDLLPAAYTAWAKLDTS